MIVKNDHVLLMRHEVMPRTLLRSSAEPNVTDAICIRLL